jgi:nitrite reductase/ring-hydroxylating ferredoxin subunit
METLSDIEFVRVAPRASLRDGRMQSCQIAGRDVVVCNTKHGVFALDNICTHALARMSEGRLKGERLICPMHGAIFDVRDGKVLAGPATHPLVTHKVRIVDSFIEVALSPGE